MQFRFIEKRYGVRTLVIIHDFNATKLENYSQIAKELAHLDVGILINNAGMHYDYPMEFAKVNEVFRILIPGHLICVTQNGKCIIDNQLNLIV